MLAKASYSFDFGRYARVLYIWPKQKVIGLLFEQLNYIPIADRIYLKDRVLDAFPRFLLPISYKHLGNDSRLLLSGFYTMVSIAGSKTIKK